MLNLEPLLTLPETCRPWTARLERATPTDKGVFRLVNIRRTAPQTFEEQRVVVLVLDENGIPLPNVPVVFGYSTGPHPVPYLTWRAPMPPYQALVVPTQGSGQIDQIQGSAVKPGQPGGITVYVGVPDIASDAVVGAGMLPDHTGLHLTFQLKRTGVLPLTDRLSQIEARVVVLEQAVGQPNLLG